MQGPLAQLAGRRLDGSRAERRRQEYVPLAEGLAVHKATCRRLFAGMPELEAICHAEEMHRHLMRGDGADPEIGPKPYRLALPPRGRRPCLLDLAGSCRRRAPRRHRPLRGPATLLLSALRSQKEGCRGSLAEVPGHRPAGLPVTSGRRPAGMDRGRLLRPRMARGAGRRQP